MTTDHKQADVMEQFGRAVLEDARLTILWYGVDRAGLPPFSLQAAREIVRRACRFGLAEEKELA